jgi:hypothetical protein
MPTLPERHVSNDAYGRLFPGDVHGKPDLYIFLPIDFKGVASGIRMAVDKEARHRFRGCNKYPQISRGCTKYPKTSESVELSSISLSLFGFKGEGTSFCVSSMACSKFFKRRNLALTWRAWCVDLLASRRQDTQKLIIESVSEGKLKYEYTKHGLAKYAPRDAKGNVCRMRRAGCTLNRSLLRVRWQKPPGAHRIQYRRIYLLHSLSIFDSAIGREGEKYLQREESAQTGYEGYS